MPKKADSGLLRDFIFLVDKGLISGNDSSAGPGVIERIATAFREILAGGDVDTALQIERKTGRARDDFTLAVAVRIGLARQQGDTWATIEKLAEEWFAEEGRDPVTLERLKAIYSANRDDVDRILGYMRFNEMAKRIGP